MRPIILAGIMLAAADSPAIAADAFDRHTTKWLQKGIRGQSPLKRVSLQQAGKLKSIGPQVASPCIVVRTNDGNLAKVLLGWGFRRGGDKLVPVLLLERFVTYRAGRGDTTAAAGKDVMLFAGFHFNLDIGQVVPAGQGGDVQFTQKGELEPLGNAKIYGLSGSQLPAPKNGAGPENRDGVSPRDFTGTWKVTVDGRWHGEMELELQDNGRLRGKYTSKESKSTYDVSGRIARLRHHVKLTIRLENAGESIDAFLFTRDKSVMAGSATLAGRDFGFYAVREKRNR